MPGEPNATATDWNFARAWEAIAAEAPDRVAIACRDRHITFGELDDRASRVATVLAGVAAGPVAICMVNSIEYVEVLFAALKLQRPPVNVNYRYTGDEIAYVLRDSGATALVYHDEFAAAVEASGFDGLALQVHHDGDGLDCYEAAVAGATPRPTPSAVSGDDLVLLYTGGTTGMPKGVMWRNDDLYVSLWQLSRPGTQPPDPVATVRAGKRAATALAASPLMHGTGLFVTMTTLAGGGTIVLLDDARLNPAAVWDAVEREAVQVLSIVGDAFARPLLASLDAEPRRWDLSSLRAIGSSGVMWSPETKKGLLAHLPGVLLIDSLGASEGLMSRSEARHADDIAPARFTVNERMKVLGDDGREVAAGSGEVGLLAVGGRLPLGYWGDPAKTATTFPTVDGTRYSIPGDYATVEADGTIRLLGRGSACINTGGEKVYPEEVEEIVKSHPAVFDAVVVGVPDERWGEMVVALVQPRAEGFPGEDMMAAFCRERMAGYKRPKRFFAVESLLRSPSGKVDYPLLRRMARELLGEPV